LSNARTTASRSTEPADRLRLIDAFYGEFNDDVPFWLALADRFGGPLLELGCGTGRVLRPLAEAGHHLVGLDNDPLALHQLKQRLAPATHARVRLLRADLPNLPLAGPFPLAIVPCNTFAYFDDPSALDMLHGLRRLAPPGGGLALDLPGPAAALGEQPGKVWHDSFHEPALDRDVQVTAHQGAAGPDGAVPVRWQFDEMLPDGQVWRHAIDLRYYPRSPQDLRTLLEQAGFQLAEVFGGYDQRPYDAQEPSLLLIAMAV